MAEEINARQMLDANGEVYFPYTHAHCVEGLPEDLADLDLGLGDVQEDVSNVQSQINSLQSLVSNLVTDTGWVNIPLSSGVTSYGTNTTPQVRLVSVSGANFLSMRGAVKGVTQSSNVDIGTLSSTFSSKIGTTLSAIQNTSVSGGKPNYSRLRIYTDGRFIIERTSIDSPNDTQWYPIDCTFML